MGADFSSVVSALASNPELVSKLTDVLKDNLGGDDGISKLISGNADTDDAENDATDGIREEKGVGHVSTEEKAENSNENEESTAVSAAVSAIPPDVMSKLPALLSVLGGTQSKKKNVGEARREALLVALKPYLRSERADAIDRILELSRLGEILKKR